MCEIDGFSHFCVPKSCYVTQHDRDEVTSRPNNIGFATSTSNAGNTSNVTIPAIIFANIVTIGLIVLV